MERAEEKIVYLHPDDVVVVEGRNQRVDMGDIEELAGMIEVSGVRMPIKVQLKDSHTELVDGQRRHLACKMLTEKYGDGEMPLSPINNMPINMLPATVVPDNFTEDQILVEMLVANEGKPFLPLEEAMMFAKLKEETGLLDKDIAARIGKSVAHVSNRLALLRADDTVKEAVQKGELTATDGVTIIRKVGEHNIEKQKELVDKVKKEGRNVIEKELKGGRLAKHQWEEADPVYEDFIGATQHPDGLIKKNGWDHTKLTEIMEKLEENPEYDLILQIGRLAGIALISHSSLTEIVNKLAFRSTGKSGKYS